MWGGSSGVRDTGLKIFSTCPQSMDVRREEYPRAVADVARWSEAAGCCGILVYADNGLVDPWLVSQLIMQHTERLSPLVAIQPIYMHPYTAAKMVATLGHLDGRRLYLHMIAGGFRASTPAPWPTRRRSRSPRRTPGSR